MILADTGALIALIDADDRHHGTILDLYERDPDAWVLPWAILPEVDYLLLTQVGAGAQLAFVRDLADARWAVEWGDPKDLIRARQLCERYRDLGLGLVDGVVMAQAERLGVEAIATLDLRHFGVVLMRGKPRILPRDLE